VLQRLGDLLRAARIADCPDDDVQLFGRGHQVISTFSTSAGYGSARPPGGV
jgi:hypothetical protein